MVQRFVFGQLVLPRELSNQSSIGGQLGQLMIQRVVNFGLIDSNFGAGILGILAFNHTAFDPAGLFCTRPTANFAVAVKHSYTGAESR